MPAREMKDAASSNPPAGMSMKARLATWRAAQAATAAAKSGKDIKGKGRISDEELHRDAVLVLQGVDGRYIRFLDPASEVEKARRDKRGYPIHILEQHDVDESALEGALYIVEDPDGPYIPQTTRDQMHNLAELGWLYRRIQSRIHIKLNDTSAGMIELALCHCLQEELREYDSLIASFETRRGGGSQSSASSNTASENDRSLSLDLASPSLGITLHRLAVWVEGHRLKMRMMGVLVESCTTTRGGALLSSLHGYTTHGDPFISSFTSSLLARVSQPFFRSLAAWIYNGELLDPSNEFFVQARRKNHDGSRDQDDSTSAAESWNGRYKFRKEMLPSFLNESFGKKIFSTGRSLNYIKYACGDGEWVSSQTRGSTSTGKTSAAPQALQYGDVAALEQSIDAAYSRASRRLFEIFFNKFGLLRHLRALKDYLLLGRGDFVELLIESLGPSLSRPANTLYRHNLTTTLEMAIRGSSSASDADDVLHRLDARMLEFSAGEAGWEVFVLEYKVDAPVDVVLDQESMRIHTRVFRQLWRIKRVEYALSEGWKRITGEARWYKRVQDLQPSLHVARVALSSMIHFVKALQAFAHLEVVDCSFTALEAFALKKEGDLDELIAAHESYVDRLASKILMRGTAGGRTDDSILKNTNKALETMLGFKDSLDALCNYALAEASRLDSERIIGGRDSRASTGTKGGLTDGRSSALSRPATPISPQIPVEQVAAAADPAVLQAITAQLHKRATGFEELVTTLVHSSASHQDLDLRFLSVRLNFSLFYLQGGSGGSGSSSKGK